MRPVGLAVLVSGWGYGPGCGSGDSSPAAAETSSGAAAESSGSSGTSGDELSSSSGEAGPQGSGTSTPAPTDGSSGEGSSSSGGPPPIVLPIPCDQVSMVYVDETAHEPNDAPELATDLCTIDVVGSWHVTAEIGGDDLIDHFVFRSAGDSGVVPLVFDACFGIGVEISLHQYDEGALTFLWSGAADSPACDEIPQALPAGHDYLLVIAIPEGDTLPAATAYGW